MAKIAYIYKQKLSDAAWSSVISELGNYLQKECENVRVFTVDNTNFNSLVQSKKSIIDWELTKGDCLVFNHAITFWLLLPVMRQLRHSGVKLIFLCHEHEHILGLSYFIRHLNFIRLKESLRHFKWWYRIPFMLSHHVVCLSSYQAMALGQLNFERISYLGIDGSRFPAKTDWEGRGTKPVIMFAHDPKRFDKGDRFCKDIFNDERYTLIYGRERILPYDEVYKKYHDADIVFLPSDCESFSLVLAEALATNSCVVTNANVGIIQLLLGVFTVDELETYGLFVCEHNAEGYRSGLIRASFFIAKQHPSTLELFKFLNLDSSSCFKRFARFLQRIEV